MLTDGRTETKKPMVVYRNFTNAPNKKNLKYKIYIFWDDWQGNPLIKVENFSPKIMTPCSILLIHFTIWIHVYLPWVDKGRPPKNIDISKTNSIFTLLSSHQMHKIITQWQGAECWQFRVINLQNYFKIFKQF